MDLVSLLLEMKPLLADPARNLQRIVSLLKTQENLAEAQVVRAFIAETVRPVVEKQTRHVDPRQRLQALRTIGILFPRSTAAKLVRHLVKDPDSSVAGAAMMSRLRLGLWHETALRDTRRPPPRFLGPLAPGGWNPSGWAFGMRRTRPPKRPAKLKPLPIPNAAALAKVLGVSSTDELTRFSRPGVGKGAPYVAFEIPKASGGTRVIQAPRAELKRIQRVILKEILAPLPLHPACHGFVSGHSTVTNARPHLGAALVVKTDLRDFFPSIHYRRVKGFFVQLGYAEVVAGTLAELTTHRPVMPDKKVVWPGALPQGAPTSPQIANLVCRRLDQRLTGLARRAGAVYTRYADDLTFSFASPPEIGLGRFFWWVDQICLQEGFAEHTGKRRIMRPKGQQRVTGLVVNSSLSVPRAARRRFRAILENCRRNGVLAEARGREDFPDYLRGFAAYVAMVQPELGKKLLLEVKDLLGDGTARRSGGPKVPAGGES